MRRLVPGRPRGRRLVAVVIAAAVVLAGGLAVVGLLRQSGAPGHGTVFGPAQTAGAADSTAGKELAGPSASAAPRAAYGTPSNSALTSISAVIAPNAHGYLVRTGDLELQVKRGGLNLAVQQITALTSAYGGYVLSSAVGSLPTGTTPLPATPSSEAATDKGVSTPSVSPVGDGQPYACIVVRIPADRFDQALTRFERLGSVRQLTTSTEDVTGQVVDLQAQLSHYRAVLARLLTFLDKASTVGAALAVQDRIDQTELTVEQLNAELKQLKETVSYSTLTMSVVEKGTKPAVHHGAGFWTTLTHSGWLIGQGALAIIVGLGAALPFLVLAIAIALAVFYGRRSIRRRRRGGPRTPTADGPPATA